MKQQTFSDIEYLGRKKKTKREEFLESMDKIIPWEYWVGLIRPYYPDGKRGRPPKGIETMLRMYLMQTWFSLSDAGIEDATTLLHFRHLIEENKIGEKIFSNARNRLDDAGLIMRGGSIVDATIISAPSSTKNEEGKRDPEMCQTKKGNQWYFGMKIHAGVDAGSGYVHTITATSANVHDIEETAKLIREDDEVAYGDSGYSGAGKREEIKDDERLASVEFRTNVRPSSLKTAKTHQGMNWGKQMENRKSSTRSKVEHPFLIVKRQFGYCKVAYRGIAKNLSRFHILFAAANLVMCVRAGRTHEFCMV